MVAEALHRSLRRERLCPPGARPVELGGDDVERMIPHRAPMRLVDRVEAFHRDSQALRASRFVARDDRGFEGHFPGEPIYPGALQLEMSGQAGLCLCWLLSHEGDRGAPPIEARLLKVNHATFLAPIGPATALTLETRVLEDDGLTGVVAGQVWVGETLCSTCILEVYLA